MNFSVFSQQEINNYKYLIIPEKFDFVKSTDQYRTSSLTKFLFNKKGFKVFLSNESFPSDLQSNRCLALITDVLDESSMFTTKSIIQFKDCYGKVIFTSKEGKSKEKRYRQAYHESIRNAFNTMSNFSYSYQPLNVQKIIEDEVVENTSDIKIDKETIVTPKVIVVEKVIEEPTIEEDTTNNEVNLLYAQPNSSGFQLVNMTPKVVFLILKTNLQDTLVIKDKNGILYKKGAIWVAQYYVNNKLVEKDYQIKF